MVTKTAPYLSSNFGYGMHACGFVYNIMFTNSLEALEYWYARGIKLFEVDIDLTDDGEYVACHNFTRETFSKMELEKIPEHGTCAWFKKQKLYCRTTPGLTPMTLKDMFGLLRRYPDSLFMLDPKRYTFDETAALLSRLTRYIEEFEVDGKRLVFELYNEDMIEAALGYPGCVQYQYCVDDEMQMGTSEKIRSWDLERLIGFLKAREIWIISYPWKFAVESLDKLKRLRDEGFLIFSKTRNDILAELLEKAGVRVNIVDYLVTDAQREELKDYKEAYYAQYAEKIDNVFGKCVCP